MRCQSFRGEEGARANRQVYFSETPSHFVTKLLTIVHPHIHLYRYGDEFLDVH